MSYLMGRGDDAEKALDDNGIDFKKLYIRLKAGESRKVRILSPEDYVAYKAHGHYNKGIFTQPCVKVAGERCLLCEAANYDGDLVDKVKDRNGNLVSEWNQMYARKRVMFAFADLEEKSIRLFDATRNQAEGLIDTIKDYADELDSVAFTFKRTGERSDTTYSLNPIMPKRMKEVQEAFDSFDKQKVETKFFEDALMPRTAEQQAAELQKAGFPVKGALGVDVKETEDSGSAKEDGGEPINIDPEDLPF